MAKLQGERVKISFFADIEYETVAGRECAIRMLGLPGGGLGASSEGGTYRANSLYTVPVHVESCGPLTHQAEEDDEH